jgi:O-acetyl-ADP-ribose deacetylase (regulator of RNase III)
MEYKEIESDLISLALSGEFDVIAHGCNCFNLQNAGIAKQMSEVFDTNNPRKYPQEMPMLRGDINKLGRISYKEYSKFTNDKIIHPRVVVVNAYTQYQPGANLDYEALTLCLRKMNHEFKGMHVGLPQIGAGIGGGVWDYTTLLTRSNEEANLFSKFSSGQMKDIKTIIQQELKDCDVTVVIYNK